MKARHAAIWQIPSDREDEVCGDLAPPGPIADIKESALA